MILLTGASGLLGRHLKIEAFRPTHEEFDITLIQTGPEADMVVHAAAYTNMEKAETDKWKCFRVNVNGTFSLLGAYPDTPFVYISTEYAKDPVNFYSLTKSLAEQLVMTHPNYLIIRTLFKPYPWPYEYAFIDKHTQGDYVDVIAPLIDEAIENWDRKTNDMIYVGTGRKTYYELAKRTKPRVKPNFIKDVSINIPSDYE